MYPEFSWVKVVAVRAGVALLLLAAMCAAPAGTVSAADEIGIFFDDDREANCLEADQFAVVTAYLAILDPTASGGVNGWECSLEVEDGSVLMVTIAGQFINLSDGLTDFCVGLGTALPGGTFVELASLQIMVTGERALFYVYPYFGGASIDGYAVYVDGADPTNVIPLTINALSGENLSAGINAHQCFPEESSWSELKQLYY